MLGGDGLLGGALLNRATALLPSSMPSVAAISQLAQDPTRLSSLLAATPLLSSPRLGEGLLTGELLDGGLVDRALAMMPNQGALLTGPLLSGDLGLLQGGLLGQVPENVARFRDMFADTFSRVTSIPQEATRNFLNVVGSVNQSVPSGSLIEPGLRQLLTQRRILQVYSDLTDEALAPFRDTLALFSRGLPNGGFMGRMSEGPLGGIRSEFERLVQSDPVLGPMRPLATGYLEDIFPVLAQFADTDAIIDRLQGDLGKTFNVGIFPRDAVARLLDLKLGLLTEMIDATVGVTFSLAEISRELVALAVEAVPAVVELVTILPNVAIDALFTMVTMITSISEGLIDLKLGVLEFILKLPLEVIDAIVGVPEAMFDSISLGDRNILRSFLDETRSITGIYNDYTGALGIPMSVFPLETFARMSQDLLRVGSVPDFTP